VRRHARRGSRFKTAQGSHRRAVAAPRSGSPLTLDRAACDLRRSLHERGTVMRRRVVLGALAVALLFPFGLAPVAAQPAAAPDQGRILRRQKRALKRLRHTDKKWFKRRRRKAKQLFKRTDEGRVRILQ
jgi:hypothetical protein